jgi:hypothetical protein
MIAAGYPIRVDHLTTVWTILYQCPSRYHWLYQYYMRAEGLAMAWVRLPPNGRTASSFTSLPRCLSAAPPLLFFTALLCSLCTARPSFSPRRRPVVLFNQRLALRSFSPADIHNPHPHTFPHTFPCSPA